MRIPACPLIVTLFAVALYLPTAIGQQPGAVNIRPRVATSQPGVPDVRATVDKHRVPLGKEVTFTLSPASVVMNSRYAVTIYFGDGTQQRTRQTQIVHCYCASGNYTYSVLVKSSGPPPTPTPTPSPSPLVPGVKLAAQPTSVTTTQTVNFAAQLSHSYPNIKYRFEFGDGSQTGWQERPQATHTYRSPDTYYTYVDIGAANYGSVKQVGGSERKPIQVTTPSQPPRPQPSASPGKPTPRSGTPTRSSLSPTPSPSPAPSASPAPTGSASPSASPNASSSMVGTSSPGGGGTTSPSPGATPSASGIGTPETLPAGGSSDTWWYVILAALVALGGYQAANYFFAPRPRLHPNVDPGDSRVGVEKPLSIDLQMELNPNVTGGQYAVDTPETSFIKSERRSDG